MRCFLVAIAAFAVVVACSGATTPNARPRAATSQSSVVAAPDAFAIPGVTTTTAPDGAQTLVAAMPCDQLARLVAASDWKLAQLAPPPLDVYELTLGNERALLKPAGSKSSCRGSVTHSRTEPLKLTGADTTDRPDASYLPFMCIDNNADDDNEYELLGLYDAADLHLLLDVIFSVAAPTGPVTPGDGDLGVAMVAHGATPMPDVLAAIMASAAAGKRPDMRQLEIYEAGHTFKGTVTVKKGNAIDGTLELSGLSAAGGKQLAVTTAFHCSLPH